MPSNDTENIYATQYGGEGEPIPATKISYDGTGTSIEATNVQGAITEIDTDLQSTKGDVSDLKTALRQNYVLADSDVNIEVTADGVKSYSDLLDDLNTAFLAYLAAMDDDELLFLTRMQITNVATLSPLGKVSGYNNLDDAVNPSFSKIELETTTISITNVKFGTTKVFIRSGITTVPAVTISDKKSDVPSVDTKLIVSAHLYKQV